MPLLAVGVKASTSMEFVASKLTSNSSVSEKDKKKTVQKEFKIQNHSKSGNIKTSFQEFGLQAITYWLAIKDVMTNSGESAQWFFKNLPGVQGLNLSQAV